MLKEKMNDTNKEVLTNMVDVETMLTNEAHTLIDSIKDQGITSADSFKLANKGLLEFYVLADTTVKNFCSKNHVEIEKGYEKYFKPYLEISIQGLSWSYSTIKKYRSINNTPQKKNEFLGIADSVSDESVAVIKKVTSDESLLKGAITRLNTLLAKDTLKSKFSLLVNNGLLELKAIAVK